MSPLPKQEKRPYKEYLVRLQLEDAEYFDKKAKELGLKGGTYMRLLVLKNMKNQFALK